MNPVFERELGEQLDELAAHQQRQVLDFARALAAKKRATVSGEALCRFGGAITKEDLGLGGRLGVWQDTVRVIPDVPLTGTGLNTFGEPMLQVPDCRTGHARRPGTHDDLQGVQL